MTNHEMNQSTSISDMFVNAYDALVNVFAYTIGTLSKSLPQSDFYCKAANELLPVANELLATTSRYNEDGTKLSSPATSKVLDELYTSDRQPFTAIRELGLLPLIQKIRMYRELIVNITGPSSHETMQIL